MYFQKPTTRKSLMAVAYTNDGEVTNVKTVIVFWINVLNYVEIHMF